MHAAHEADDKDLDLRYSLGFYVDDDKATIGDVIPRSPADAAGASPGSHLVALNGYKWSKELLHDTLAAPPDPSGTITLLIEKDDMFKTLELKYSGGERYPNLVKDAGFEDVLASIARPGYPRGNDRSCQAAFLRPPQRLTHRGLLIKSTSFLDDSTATPSHPSDTALVIFDCDGVLVDSEPITNRVLAQMINELGIPMTMRDMHETFLGRSMAFCCDLIAEMLGRPLPIRFLEQYRLRTTAAWMAELKAIRGIETVLDALDARNIPFCVASSSSHHEMRTTLGLTGLLPRFDNKLLSVTEVPAAKPAPDVYLYAASQYAIAPSKCCVVEDSPIGVRAGVAAGMCVYGYCGLTPRDRLTEAGAHFTVADMPDLLKLWFGNTPC